MVKNLLRSAVLKLVLKLATDVDFTTASDRLFQTSTILQLKILPSIATAARLNNFKTMNLLSLDPFRKMFKRQKHHFVVKVAAENFTGDV